MINSRFLFLALATTSTFLLPACAQTQTAPQPVPVVPTGAAPERLFPADAVLNVRDFGAKGDGQTDDTAAILALLRKHGGKKKTLYFPNGTYIIKDTLDWKNEKGAWICYTSFQGQSRDKTILKLPANTPGFDDPKKLKALVMTASQNPRDKIGSGNEAFRNYIFDLSIEIAEGNPGAIALDYLANNLGAVRNVSIRGSGAVGLSMKRYGPGPCLIKNVSIDGFEIGADVSQQDYGVTFEHFTVKNQGKIGVRNAKNVLSMRDFRSENSVPALQNLDSMGHVTLIDANFKGGDAQIAAIDNQKGVLLARNIEVAGYKSAISNAGKEVSGLKISEYVSHPGTSWGGEAKTLNLPVRETPEFWNNDLTSWVSVKDFGAIGGDNKDDGPAIQKAFDFAAANGKTTVYFPSFPSGLYNANSPLFIRGKVRHIAGMSSSISTTNLKPLANDKPALRIETEADLVIDRFNVESETGIEHASKSALILQDTLSSRFRNTPNCGPLFLDDWDNGRFNIEFLHPQQIWARQYNTEGAKTPTTLNRGATLWILGIKCEGENTVVQTEAGGKTEILGGFLYPVGKPRSRPALINADSQVSASFATTAYADDRNYFVQIEERRGKAIFRAISPDLPGRGAGSQVPLYAGNAQTAAPADFLALSLSSPALPDNSKLLTLTQGEKAEIAAQIEGKPSGEIEWFDKNQKIGAGHSLSWLADKQGARFITARAKNAAGQIWVSAPISINVLAPEKKAPPLPLPTDAKPLEPGQTLVAASADAFVRDGQFATITHGKRADLIIKKFGQGNSREAFLSFDATQIPANAKSVVLRLYGKMQDAKKPGSSVAVLVGNLPWDETMLSWNARPAVETKAATFKVSDDTYRTYDVDVTAALLEELKKGAKTVTIVLRGARDVETPFVFASKEANVGGPALVVTP